MREGKTRGGVSESAAALQRARRTEFGVAYNPELNVPAP